MKKLALLGAGALLLLALTGCDDRKCLQSHTDLMPIWMADGKGGGHMSLIPITTCDKYEEKTP